MALHRFDPHPRRRLALVVAAAAAALGVLAAVLSLRPDTAAVQDTGVVAALPAATAPAAVPPPALAVPVATTVAATTTTARPSTTTTAATTPRRGATTKAVAAAPPSGAGGRVLTLVNAARADAGCRPLTRSAALEKAATDYAALMSRSGTFSHTGPDGSDFSDRARAAGYADPGGENIAQGQSSADEVMTDWMNSPGHRRNILDCSFRTLGVGHAADGDYWAQEFGR